MNWYMALNEAGTRGDIALHTKLAVLSARQHTTLSPKMLYIGGENAFTAWLRRHDVEVLPQTLPYIDVINQIIAENRYDDQTIGHWLRTNVCLAEKVEDFVLYTDVDVIFAREPELADIKPDVFAAAPEFQVRKWNYFNAGVMCINNPRLCASYPAFEAYLRQNIYEHARNFHDQIAYNVFYRQHWERLPQKLNWKPYWGISTEAEIVHFHGPKIGAIEAIVNGSWSWGSEPAKQIGGLFLQHIDAYRHYVGSLATVAQGLEPEECDRILKLSAALRAFDGETIQGIDTRFMDFQMFPEDRFPPE